jgi:phenylacetate-coenzyme A ligase PaaK-like adenylate-forming protein
VVDQESSTEANVRFRQELLLKTIEHARRSSSFYARLWGDQAEGIRIIEDLSRLPIVDKLTISRYHSDLITSDELPALVQKTSGTSGRSLPVYRSVAEVAFIKEFFTKVIGPRPSGPAAVILNLTDTYHGPPLEIPGHNYSIPICMTDDAMLEEAVRLIREPLQIPGAQKHISAIIGLVPYLKMFTSYLLELGFDFGTCQVATIVPIATALSSRWRSLLSDTWNAEVVDRYSLAEIFGGATLCLKCQSYHFDSTVIPEVVDPVSGGVVTAGVGILVLTSLYPFVQMQPMIRYRTDDLVEIAQDSCRPELSVRFLGRLANACLLDGEVLIRPMDVNDILDNCPDVAATERLHDIFVVKDHSAAGVPRYEMQTGWDETGRAAVTWRVGLRWSPSLYPESSSTLALYLTSAILARSQALRQSLSEGKCVFRVELSRADELGAPQRKI